MNKTISRIIRQQIKDGLKQLPDSWQTKFKRMYSQNNLDWDIETVVDNMPNEKLDWALSQVENSLKRFITKIITNHVEEHLGMIFN